MQTWREGTVCGVVPKAPALSTSVGVEAVKRLQSNFPGGATQAAGKRRRCLCHDHGALGRPCVDVNPCPNVKVWPVDAHGLQLLQFILCGPVPTFVHRCRQKGSTRCIAGLFGKEQRLVASSQTAAQVLVQD